MEIEKENDIETSEKIKRFLQILFSSIQYNDYVDTFLKPDEFEKFFNIPYSQKFENAIADFIYEYQEIFKSYGIEVNIDFEASYETIAKNNINYAHKVIRYNNKNVYIDRPSYNHEK
jgi:hypothetical protein